MSAQRTHEREYMWLHDDSEEDLVGADWHQRAITGLYNSLRDVALLAGLPWHVGNQLTLIAWKPDGMAWRPSPDIMVHSHAGPELRKEMATRDAGPPALIIEVASQSTWEYDVDTAAGKAMGYLALGVPSYLVFDPTQEYLGYSCRGWQRVGGVAREWRPTPDGRYEDNALGVSFRPDGDLLRVIDALGQPIAYEYEKTQEIMELRARLEQLRASGTTPPSAPTAE
jgi:Uma2 family endonuclease